MAKKFRLKYNNNIIVDNLDLESVYSKTLPCSGKLMGGDLVLESYISGRLPDGFQEVEYIQSDGNSYINTAFGCTSDINFSTKMKIVSGSSANIWHANIFGIAGDDGTRWGLNIRTSYSEFWFFTIGMSTAITSSISYSTLFSDFTMSVNTDKQLIINDAVVTTVNTSPSHGYSVYLCKGNYNNGAAAYGGSSIRIYYFTISNGSTLSRNFVPCYCTTSVTAYQGATATTAASGTIGLYDLVNSRFYINSGSGTFTKGPDVTS